MNVTEVCMRSIWLLFYGLLGMGCSTLRQEAPPVVATVPRLAPDLADPLVATDDACPSVEALCEILEIVDVHTQATSRDKGFEELRVRARALQADAVIGAEFEHGGGGEPSHLSGMIVRYGKPLPPVMEIGQIEIASDSKSSEKGLAELIRRGREMGGDRVVGVTFEHGEEGAPGRLKGRVVRYIH